MSVISLFIFTLAALGTDPWPQFRGANATGVAASDNPPIHFSATSNALWKTLLPSGASSPCVWQDRIFLTGSDGNTLATICRQRRNGKILWRDARDGHRLWRVERPDFRMSWSSPVAWKHDCLQEIVLAGFVRAKAYDLKSGQERWTIRELPTAVCTMPVMGDGLLFFAGWASAGSNEPMPPFGQIVAPLDKHGDCKLAFDEAQPGWLKDFFKFFDTDKDEFITPPEWDPIIETLKAGKNVLVAIRPGGSGDISETHMVWSWTRGLPYVASPLYYEGRIFIVKDGGLASCFDAKTGKVFYQQERLDVPGDYYSSPIAAAGKIYTASLSGIVILLKAGEKLNVVARNQLGVRIFATPAIVGDQLYVRTERAVCFRQFSSLDSYAKNELML